MIMSLREKDIHTKREGETSDGKFAKPASTSSSRQWSGFKNPRIVRVSSTFGGKDRHSKVTTIRGLRDRRIRLSVPTAIQLYDLQDRLGLSQPSKVIDWLLDATKLDIDNLPPLQIPMGNFAQFHQSSLDESNGPHQPSLTPFLDANLAIVKDGTENFLLSSKQGIDFNNDIVEKEVEGGMKWNKTCEDGDEEDEDHGRDGGNNAQVSAQNFFPVNGNNSYFPGLLANNSMAYNYYHWEPSNLAVSQFGSLGLPSQVDHPDAHNNVNNTAIPFIPSSALVIPSGSQLFFRTSMAAASASPSYVNTQAEYDFRRANRFHQSSSSLSPAFYSSSSAMKSFPFSINHPGLHSHESNHNQPNNDDAST
ncbi:hypothetical protein Nepgr_033401 [Nepenthes gracilis]|uniref:TCP domain-containing protein n=1 Tax=Nepenthes gracilis TaxID=150966 RepID=A0AAD3Y6J8_NEPGR|nr:hypothetical protein Nepgr_033401 [Nepenthes gracilis]